MKKNILFLLMAACGAIFLYSAWKLYGYHASYKEAEHTYERVRKQAVSKRAKGKQERDIDFEQLKKINSDVVGWIYVPGTKIDYPIVKGEDNEEYLHKTFDGKKNSSGAVFMDKDGKSNFLADNNLIYGHHMKNGTMFADLLKFREPSFVKKNQEIVIITPKQTKRLKVISAYAQKAKGSIPIMFSDQKSRRDYLDEICEKSEVRFSVSGKVKREKKQIYTFVTCSYEKEDYRTFVHAVEESVQ